MSLFVWVFLRADNATSSILCCRSCFAVSCTCCSHGRHPAVLTPPSRGSERAAPRRNTRLALCRETRGKRVSSGLWGLWGVLASPSVPETLGAIGWIPRHTDSHGPLKPQRQNTESLRDRGGDAQPRACPAPSAPPRRQHRPRPPSPRRPGTAPAADGRGRGSGAAPGAGEGLRGAAPGARAQGGRSPSSRRRTMGAAALLWAALWALLLPPVRTRGRAAGPAWRMALPVASVRGRPRGSSAPHYSPGARRPRTGPAQLPSPTAGLGWAPPASEHLGLERGPGVWASWTRPLGSPHRARGAQAGPAPVTAWVEITNLTDACVDKPGV